MTAVRTSGQGDSSRPATSVRRHVITGVPTQGGAGGTRRHPARPSGDDRYLAILATAERLLEHRDLGEISTDDLARGAGISRPTFYFYFPSKDAVLVALLRRVIDEAEHAVGDTLDRIDENPRAVWRDAIGRFFETFRSHRAVALACAQARHSNVEVRQLWAAVMTGWVRRTEDAILGERRRGAAPPGIAARDLAIALNSMNERVLYATFAGADPAVAEERAVDVLLDVWMSSIYQITAPPSRRSRASSRELISNRATTP